MKKKRQARAHGSPRARSGPAASSFTVRELQHVRLLHELRSFQQAAQRAGISQPALSQSIAAIERRLGVSLFTRTRRSVTPTAFADLIAQRAQVVLPEIERIDEQIDAIRDARKASLAFGIGLVPAARLLRDAMTRAYERQPAVRLNAAVGLAPELRERVLAGELEFAVLLREPDETHEQLDYETLYEEPFVFLSRSDHPLTSHVPVSCRELVRFPVVSFDTRYFPRQIQRHLATAEDFALLDRNVPAIALQRPELLADFVAISDHVLLGVLSSFRAELAAGRLVRLEVEHLRMDTTASIVTRRGAEISPASRLMTDTLRELAAEMSREGLA
jgi:DNA-binding transcriptional LysR family regulator